MAVGYEAMSERKARSLPRWWNKLARNYAGELQIIVEALENREADAVAEVLANAFLDSCSIRPTWERLRIAAGRGHPAAMRELRRSF